MGGADCSSVPILRADLSKRRLESERRRGYAQGEQRTGLAYPQGDLPKLEFSLRLPPSTFHLPPSALLLSAIDRRPVCDETNVKRTYPNQK